MPRLADRVEPRLVQVSRPRCLRLLDEREIEIGPIPMRVGDVVVGTGGDQQLPGVIRVVRESLVESMEEEREPALEAAGDVRMRPLPRAPLRERADLRQVVAIGELFEQQIGQRRRRFADGESSDAGRVR